MAGSRELGAMIVHSVIGHSPGTRSHRSYTQRLTRPRRIPLPSRCSPLCLPVLSHCLHATVVRGQLCRMWIFCSFLLPPACHHPPATSRMAPAAVPPASYHLALPSSLPSPCNWRHAPYNLSSPVAHSHS